MPKAKNAKADEALKLYRQGLKLIEISEQLGVPEGTIRSWKNRQQWDENVATENCNVAKRKRGAQPGNKNASGAPPGNKHAEKYGFLAKYLPDETKEIFDSVAHADPLDLLWHQIQLQYAAILRAQKIAFVKDQLDMTKETVSESDTGESWDIQQAWDKQAAFLSAQSRAMGTLSNLIRQYDKMLQDRGEHATEEQKLRLEKLRAETEVVKKRVEEDTLEAPDDGFLEALNSTAAEDWAE